MRSKKGSVGFNRIKRLKVLSLELGFMGVIRYN